VKAKTTELTLAIATHLTSDSPKPVRAPKRPAQDFMRQNAATSPTQLNRNATETGEHKRKVSNNTSITQHTRSFRLGHHTYLILCLLNCSNYMFQHYINMLEFLISLEHLPSHNALPEMLTISVTTTRQSDTSDFTPG